MATPVPVRQSWLTRPRVVGTPLAWSRGAAGFGGIVGALGPLALLMPSALAAGGPVHLLAIPSAVCGLAGLVVGGLLGLVQPALLDRVRGRVPLALVAFGQAAVGALVGATAAVAPVVPLVLVMGPPPDLWGGLATIAGYGAAVGGIATLAWWLPFTVALVTGRRTGPVTTFVAALTTLIILLVA